jgi:hypothetical protein
METQELLDSLHLRSDGFVENAEGDFAVVMKNKTGVKPDGRRWFRFKTSFQADPIVVTWERPDNLALFPEVVARALIGKGYGASPTPEFFASLLMEPLDVVEPVEPSAPVEPAAPTTPTDVSKPPEPSEPKDAAAPIAPPSPENAPPSAEPIISAPWAAGANTAPPAPVPASDEKAEAPKKKAPPSTADKK